MFWSIASSRTFHDKARELAIDARPTVSVNLRQARQKLTETAERLVECVGTLISGNSSDWLIACMANFYYQSHVM